MKNILCYGDSNTFGSIPLKNNRYSIDERWTGILQSILGNEYRIIEEGLGGRTTIFDDPILDGRNGVKYLPIFLGSHKPLDLIIIALGTNDLKSHFASSSNTITQGIKRIINEIKNFDYGINYNKPKILILAPPVLGDKADTFNGFSEFNQNSVLISKELAGKYKLLCEQENVYFFDLGTIIESSEEDQIHFTKEAHKIIAEHLSKKIKTIFE